MRDKTGTYTRCTYVPPDAAPAYTPTFVRPCIGIGNAVKYMRTKTKYHSYIPQKAYLCEVVVIGRERTGEYWFFEIDLLAFSAGQR